MSLTITNEDNMALMKQQLRYWRDLHKQEKEAIKLKHNVKIVTFEFICKVYDGR